LSPKVPLTPIMKVFYWDNFPLSQWD